ncbi:MAG TPA: amino acid permease [Pirellulaceae bacterium]|nr:amino acid permease [Pirellulaceae bacterium]
MSEPATLKRSLGLPMLTFYGLGTIVGGGFYALIGEVSAEAGMLMPLAFLAAALIGLLSAFSFAELSARYPVSAGESQYVLEAFGRRWLSAVVGWMVILTGVVSAATLARAFARFAETLVAVPDEWVIAAVVIGLGVIAAWGIAESVWLATIITIIEVGGLLFVCFAGSNHLAAVPDRWPELIPSFSFTEWSSIFLGAYVAFYSFVGFEDLVNVAEEVKQPHRTLPAAILISLGLTALLYGLVTLVAVLAVPMEQLAESKSPLSLIVGEGTTAAKVMACIGMLAGVNGALVQIVMASRVAYGMSKIGLAPRVFSNVHQLRQTPIEATSAGALCVLLLALWFPLIWLAKATSTILLIIYALVNLSLLVIKRRHPDPQGEGPRYAIWLPLLGFTSCVMFLVFHAVSVLL